MVEYVRPCTYERDGCLATGRCIVEAVQINLSALNPRVDLSCAVHPALVRRLYRWQLYTAYEPEDVTPGQPSGDHAREVTGLLQPEDERDDIPPSSTAGGYDDYCGGVIAGDPLGGILKLEPVGEDQVVALGRIGSESLTLLRGGARLDVAGLDSERILQSKQPLVCCRIPGSVRNRPGGD